MSRTASPDVTPLIDIAEKDRIARGVPVVRTAPEGDLEAVLNRNVTGMALALGVKADRCGTPIYAGTVYGAEKAKRRAIGKRQRAARKVHR